MTEKEALGRTVDYIKRQTENERLYYSKDENLDFAKTVKIALEKQIPYPLKPNKCKGSAIPVCGKCGGIMDLMQGDLNYCPNCGQKLLWEVEE